MQDAARIVNDLGRQRSLGLKRWDRVLELVRYSATVSLPVKIGNKLFDTPFYIVFEKLFREEAYWIKPVKGDPYSYMNVMGFFGLSDFTGFKYGMQIVLTEGISDWAVWKKYYKYTLSTLGAKISRRQMWMLKCLTTRVGVAFDPDAAGMNSWRKYGDRLEREGITPELLMPPDGDWAEYYDDEFTSRTARILLTRYSNRYNKGNDSLVHE